MKKNLVANLLLIASSFIFGAIETNTWSTVNMDWRLPVGIPGAVWSTTDGYCTAIFDDSTNRVLWRTGVGQNSTVTGCKLFPGYYSNAMLSWDMGKDTAYAGNIHNWGGGSYGGGCFLPAFYTDTTPSPRHTYDGITYSRSNHSVYLMLGANWKHIAGLTGNDSIAVAQQLAVDNNSTWRLSLADGKWHRIQTNIRQFWPSVYTVSQYETHLRVWSQGNRLLFTDGAKHAEMDLSTEIWTNVQTAYPNLKCPIGLYNARSAWDSKRQLWVFQNDTNTCTYNPATKIYKLLPSSKISSRTISYDSKRDVYLIVGAHSKTTRYFSYTDSCWYAPDVTDSVTIGQGYLVYDSLNDYHAWVYQKSAKRFRLDTLGSTSIESNTNGKTRIAALKIAARPNPFTPATTFYVNGSLKNKITLEIIDIRGALVHRSEIFSGRYEWNAVNIPSGRYTARISQNGLSSTANIILVK